MAERCVGENILYQLRWAVPNPKLLLMARYIIKRLVGTDNGNSYRGAAITMYTGNRHHIFLPSSISYHSAHY